MSTMHSYPDKVDIEDLMTATEAAELAGVKLGTFTSYVNRGYCPPAAVQIAGRRLWTRASIVKWIENRPGQGRRTDIKNPEQIDPSER